MTRSPIHIEKPPFRPVTDTLSSSSSTPITASTSTILPSAAVPAYLSSIFVPRKPSPQRADYIINRVHIDNIIILDAVFLLIYSRNFHKRL